MKIDSYKSVSLPDCFNISPSSITTFMDNPRHWADVHIHKKGTFIANTNTVFGTIMHSVAEQYFNGDKLNQMDVEDYLNQYNDIVEVDNWFILDNWEASAKVLIEAIKHKGRPDKQEYQTIARVTNGYSIGGTVDYLRGTTLGDYKSATSCSKSIGNHLYQLMVYAFVERLNGTQITHVEVTYIQRPDAGSISEKTGKPIGVKPAKVEIVTKEISQEDWDMIEKQLKMVVRTMKVYRENPELEDVLFRENLISFRR